MTRHYLDPTREPRECKSCVGVGERSYIGKRKNGVHDGPAEVFRAKCHTCHGTGRLGDENAQPDVSVQNRVYDNPRGWYYRVRIPDDGGIEWLGEQPVYDRLHRSWTDPAGPFPTPEAALEAAREANRNGR